MATNNGNGNGNGFKHKSQRIAAFKREYPKYGTVGMTLKAIGIKCRKTFYNWLESDAAFKRYYEEELKPNRIDELVSAAFEIATGGRLKTSKTMGIVIDATKPQTDMIKYLLACFDPEHYSEKTITELQGKGGADLAFRVIREDRREVGSSEE